MTIRHHPGDEFLLAHASGAGSEAVSLIVGTHLALCPSCRGKVTSMEQMGGALLASIAPVESLTTSRQTNLRNRPILCRP